MPHFEEVSRTQTLTDRQIVDIQQWCDTQTKLPKFLGCPQWVPFYWELGQHDFVDIITAEGWFVFDLTKQERDIFPALQDVDSVEVRNCDTMFQWNTVKHNTVRR